MMRTDDSLSDLRRFDKFVRIAAARRGEQTGTGRRWGLSLADRALLVAVYYRTNLTYQQNSAAVRRLQISRRADRGPSRTVLAPVKKTQGPDTVLMVDRTLVSTHDRSTSASSTSCWSSAPTSALAALPHRSPHNIGRAASSSRRPGRLAQQRPPWKLGQGHRWPVAQLEMARRQRRRLVARHAELTG
jgi:hypothetical protein